VFPLAFPFIAGPGALATILLAFGPASGSPLLMLGLLACVAVVLVIALLTLYLAAPIMRVMGVTGANVVNRLFGVVLGALAVQYVLDGLRGSFPQLH
jgi:multiple antibiotic resistance protein